MCLDWRSTVLGATILSWTSAMVDHSCHRHTTHPTMVMGQFQNSLYTFIYLHWECFDGSTFLIICISTLQLALLTILRLFYLARIVVVTFEFLFLLLIKPFNNSGEHPGTGGLHVTVRTSELCYGVFLFWAEFTLRLNYLLLTWHSLHHLRNMTRMLWILYINICQLLG